ncbi:MAG TPA: aconitate hydratase, partial [Leptolinea sp.]
SPPLVVAYALAGRVDINFDIEPVGLGKNGSPIFLRDLWPSTKEITAIISKSVTPDLFKTAYEDIFSGDAAWQALDNAFGVSYHWDESSSYIQEPPYFISNRIDLSHDITIRGARILAMFGDSVTTDHISPAGNIAIDSPAGKYLQDLKIAPQDFNSYGSRRGNDRVMVRGTFANQRLRNQMAGGKEGGFTSFQPDGNLMTIFDASVRYLDEKVPLVILAGKEYGSGSSRDWAAKGPLLLGVRAVIAESFERIHRSNLAGMGILPLQFLSGENAASLGMDGTESLQIEFVGDNIFPGCQTRVIASRANGKTFQFHTKCRLDTPLEIEYYLHEGLLPEVLSAIE